MSGTNVVAVILIVLGVLGLIYGGFTVTKEKHTADLGPVTLAVEEKERINIPLWAGVAAIAGGVVLLVARKR